MGKSKRIVNSVTFSIKRSKFEFFNISKKRNTENTKNIKNTIKKNRKNIQKKWKMYTNF